MCDNFKSFCAVTLAIWLGLTSSPAVFAQNLNSESSIEQKVRATLHATHDKTVDDQIDATSTLILAKLIEFDRWFLHYRMVATEEPKTRHLRYFLMQDAAAGLTVASQIEGLSEAALGMRHPDRVDTSTQHESTTCGLVSTILEGSSSTFELGSNALLAMKNKRHLEDPETARKQAIKRIQEIDDLIDQRDKLRAQASDACTAIHADEAKLLKYFRNRTVLEFSETYADVKSFQKASNIYYALDVFGSAVFFASYVMGMKAFANKRYDGPSFIAALFADTVYFPASPIFSHTYESMKKHWSKDLAKSLKELPYNPNDHLKTMIEQLSVDAHRWRNSQTESSATNMLAEVRVFDRISAYELWAKRVQHFIDMRQSSLRRMSRVARQDDIAGPTIATAFMGADIVDINAVYRLNHNEKASNANIFAGLIPTTAAAVADMGLTTGWFIGDELEHHHLKKKGALPEQLIEERLRTLDELEAVLKSGSMAPSASEPKSVPSP